MPGPLSRAASGASYTGAWGNDAGDVSRAAAAFMQGRKQAEDERHKQAMDLALQHLREREADQGDQRIQIDRDQMAQQNDQFGQRLGLDREGQGIERDKMGQGDRQFGQRLGFDQSELGQRATEGEANRKNALEIARIGAQSREKTAGMRMVSSGRDFITFQDENGKMWRMNKVTNEVTPIIYPGQGEQPQPDSAAPGVATGGAQPETGPGAQVRGSGARPTADEKSANMLVTSIEPSVARIEARYGGDTPQAGAPTVMEQFMADQSKSHGLGPVSAVARSLGNTALGKMNPDYQSTLTDMTKIYRAFVYVTTGKQLNESEAADAAQQYVVLAGDNPELVKKKVGDIKNMTNAVRQSSQRARSFIERQNAGQGAPPAPSAAPAAAPSAAAASPADRWEELRKSGLSPEAATAQVKQEMGQ